MQSGHEIHVLRKTSHGIDLSGCEIQILLKWYIFFYFSNNIITQFTWVSNLRSTRVLRSKYLACFALHSFKSKEFCRHECTGALIMIFIRTSKKLSKVQTSTFIYTHQDMFRLVTWTLVYLVMKYLFLIIWYVSKCTLVYDVQGQ